MEDEPGTSSLKKEWNLLWSSLAGENKWPEIEEDFEGRDVVKNLSAEEIQKLSKSLSQSRQSLHQKLEQLQKIVKQHEEKLEAARLVNGDTTEIEQSLSSFIEQGQSMAKALQRIDERIRNL